MVHPNHWKPTDSMIFEQEALDAIRNISNSLIKAGPGAGKTELLAQKANYLLTTNTCSEPKKILAISFKRDAAANLLERVSDRVPENIIRQFYSVTFDSFAKNLLDRFIFGLPESWRPNEDYEVDTKLNGLAQASSEQGVNLNKYIIEESLTTSSISEMSNLNMNIWKIMLHGNNQGEAYLSFKMITRLVIFLLKRNPYILDSLRKTYQFVFLDEFQDTTVLQYELLILCFGGSDSNITAVGDDRQRIMGWAGALPDSFAVYKQDFSARTYQLFINYRSDLKIQKLLHVVNKYAQMDLIGSHEIGDSEIRSKAVIQVRSFNNDYDEANNILNSIQRLVKLDVKIDDICILVKQLPEDYVKVLSPIFIQQGIEVRNEAIFQDLLKEDIVHIILNTVLSAVDKRDSSAWTFVLQLKKSFLGIDAFSNMEFEEAIVEETKKYLGSLRNNLIKVDSFDSLIIIFQEILNFYGLDNIRAHFIQYTNIDYLENLVETLCDYLYYYYEKRRSWKEAILYFSGKNSVSLMTIHKSKGLEFNTIFLLGLDDQAFWSFAKEPKETTATFFVAISRAKQNVIITFANKRKNKQCRRILISDYYVILAQSNLVKFLDYRENSISD